MFSHYTSQSWDTDFFIPKKNTCAVQISRICCAGCPEQYAGGILWESQRENSVAFAPCRDADSRFRSVVLSKGQIHVWYVRSPVSMCICPYISAVHKNCIQNVTLFIVCFVSECACMGKRLADSHLPSLYNACHLHPVMVLW